MSATKSAISFKFILVVCLLQNYSQALHLRMGGYNNQGIGYYPHAVHYGGYIQYYQPQAQEPQPMAKPHIICCKIPGKTATSYAYCLSTQCTKYKGDIAIVNGKQVESKKECPNIQACADVYNEMFVVKKTPPVVPPPAEKNEEDEAEASEPPESVAAGPEQHPCATIIPTPEEAIVMSEDELKKCIDALSEDKRNELIERMKAHMAQNAAAAPPKQTGIVMPTGNGFDDPTSFDVAISEI